SSPFHQATLLQKESYTTDTKVTNTIRELRHANGDMTQAELADKLGLTRQTIIAIEKGKYSPSLEVAFKMARVFRVPLEEVFFYDAE
ncbi:MAG: helix-turn-helix transcriptional regulator, partial [Spirochaetales bacterium]